MSATALEVAILLAIGAGLDALRAARRRRLRRRRLGPAGARARRATASAALIAAAIGPVWEANHVWLIFVVTALFAAFPAAFAALGVALYLPFGIAIAGIVMRGAAFAFRAYGEPDTGWQRAWTRVFGIASLVTPVVLGMCAAAIASGGSACTATWCTRTWSERGPARCRGSPGSCRSRCARTWPRRT